MANNEVGFSIKINGVDTTVKSLVEMQQAIKDLTKEASEAEYGSKNFEQITERIQTAKAAVREFKNDTRTKEVRDQFNDLAGGISGSFDVAEGALKSFGVESKALAGISSTANGLITAALNARAIADLKVDAAQARRMITEKAAAAGTVILNTVNKALNLTLKANPIGLIVTALGLLVVGIMMAINPIKKFISQFDFLTDAVDATVDAFRNVASFLTGGLIDDAATAKTRSNADKTIAALDDVSSAGNRQIAESKRRLALMEAQGATEAQLLEQKKKINREEVASRMAAINELIKLQQIDGELDDDKKKKLAELQEAVKDLNNQARIDQAAYNKKVADDQRAANEKAADKQKAANEKAADAQKQKAEKYKEYLKEIQGATEDSDKKLLALQQKAELDAIKDEDEKAKRSLEIQQEAAQKELQLQIDKYAKKKNLSMEEQKLLTSLYAQQKQLTETQGQETQNLLDTQANTKKEKEAAFQLELEDLKNQSYLMGIENARTRAAAELQIQLDKQIAEINASELTEQQKTEKILAAREVNQALVTEQQAGFKQADMESEMSFNNWQIEQESTTYAQKIALNAENEEIIKNMTFENENQRTMAIAANAEARKQIDANAAAAKEANLNAINGMLQNASALLGKDTVAGKAVAVASATIDTYQSATKAYKSLVGIPIVGPALAAVAAGIAVAGGLMNIKKIVSVQVPTPSAGGGGGGGGAAPAPAASKFASGGLVTGPGTGVSDSIPAMLSNGESVINANSTSMFGGLLNQINQAGGGAPIGDTTQQQTQQVAPIFKTYVVASDMSSQMEADKRITDLAKI